MSSSVSAIDQTYMTRFRAYATGSEWNVKPETLDAENGFITQQLRYHFALATVGAHEAVRVRNEYDKEIAKAIDALPRANALAESARRVLAVQAKKKPAKVAFPGGSR